MWETLLTTKLYRPPVRPDWVSRPRLLHHLQRTLTCPLTLICAPAGYGKTTLITTWLHHLTTASTAPIRPVWAWLSLDEADNDPVRFWVYVIAALRTACPDSGEKALTLLQSPQSTSISLVLTFLLNDLAALSTPLCLILDDYHLINNRTIHEGMSFWLDHLPPQVHLILTSRMDPPLPLARLRVRGQLNELRAADLRFTPEEAAAFLQEGHGLTLTGGDIQALESRTEGWVAGLQLAALALSASSTQQTAFIAEFRGTHRHLVDYLTEEVLDRQPESVQQFLLHTALLERFCAPLCTALFAPDSPAFPAETILEQLMRANLFLIPLDYEGRWYRYHHLFADLLRFRARQRLSPTTLNRIHRNAAAWFESNHLWREAIHQALAAEAPEMAGRIIGQQALSAVVRGETATLAEWLSALPPAQMQRDVRLGLAQAWVDLFGGQIDAAAYRLQAIIPHLQSVDDGESLLLGEALAIRATLTMGSEQAEQSIADSEQALRLLPPAYLPLRSLITWHLAFTYRTIGAISQSLTAYRDAITLSGRGGNVLINLSARRELADLLWGQGDSQSAQAMVTQLLDEMAAQGLTELYPAYGGHLLIAEMAYEANQLDTALSHIQMALHLPPPPGMGLDAYGYALLAQVYGATRDGAAAEEAIRQAEQRLQQTLHPNRRTLTLARLTHFWLNQGQLTQASLWLPDGREVLAHPRNEFFLQQEIARARYYLLTQEPATVRPQVEALLTEAQACGRVRDQLCLHLLLAYGQTDPTPHLRQALTLAEPLRLIRPFLDAGSQMGIWLSRLQGQADIPTAYLNQLLSALALADTLPANRLLVEPLSDRELEVLRLMAEGYANREIADKLIFTVATAKKHAEHIYGKLGVSSRTQAIARGRELGLI